MTTKVEDATYMVLVERQILELEKRLADLQNVIQQMKVVGVDSTNQVELFTDMSDAVRAVRRFREEVLSQSGAEFASEPTSLPVRDELGKGPTANYNGRG
jgi:hypothetical protein